MSERDKEGERFFAHVYLYTIESREYAHPPFVYPGRGDPYISM